MTDFDVDGAALVMLDCQEGVAARAFRTGDDRRGFVERVQSVVPAALESGMPIVRVEVEFRTGHIDVAASNAYFSGVREAGRLVAGSAQAGTMNELSALMADLPRVVKRRIGGVANTDLTTLLRGLACDGIVLMGLVTRGAVLSTAAHAADLDYRVAVLKDGCYDPDPNVHEVLMTDVLPLRAHVLSSSEMLSALDQQAREER